MQEGTIVTLGISMVQMDSIGMDSIGKGLIGMVAIGPATTRQVITGKV